jgi:hypothetical protein
MPSPRRQRSGLILWGVEETEIDLYPALLLRTLGTLHTYVEEVNQIAESCMCRAHTVSHHHGFRVSSRMILRRFCNIGLCTLNSFV